MPLSRGAGTAGTEPWENPRTGPPWAPRVVIFPARLPLPWWVQGFLARHRVPSTASGLRRKGPLGLRRWGPLASEQVSPVDPLSGHQAAQDPCVRPPPLGRVAGCQAGPRAVASAPLAGAGMGRAPAPEQGCGPPGAWVHPPVHHADSGTREEAPSVWLEPCARPSRTPIPLWERAEQATQRSPLMKL